jgi:hypothetical protein
MTIQILDFKSIKSLTLYTTNDNLKILPWRARFLFKGRIQNFKLGGRTLKKIAPSGGRLKNCWGISCENSRFYAKKAEYRISLLPLTSNSKNKTVVSKLHCMSNEVFTSVAQTLDVRPSVRPSVRFLQSATRRTVTTQVWDMHKPFCRDYFRTFMCSCRY